MTFGVVRLYLRLPPAAGGMEAHIGEVSDEQRRRGRVVINVYNDGAGVDGSVQVLRGLTLRHVRPDALRKLIFYLGCLANRAWIKRQMKTNGAAPFVMHVHGGWSDFLLGALLARSLGLKTLIGAVHGEIAPQKAGLFAFALRPYAAVYVTGRRDQALLEERLPGRTQHITSGVKACFLAPETGRRREENILWVGSLVRVKDPHLALEVARRLPHRRLRLIGDGPMRDEMTAAAADLPNVEISGPLAPKELAEAMREAGVLLSTSRVEGTPTVFFEAMACGLPIVATASNDFSWLIEDGVNGWVLPSRNPQALAERLEEILAHRERADAMGEINRRRAEDFAWPAITDRIETLIAQALAEARP